MSISIFKLNCISSGYPYLLSGALPRGYLNEYFNGEPLPDAWTPPPCELKRVNTPLPDILAWKENLPLLSKRAFELFEKRAPGCAEYKEFLSIRGNPYYVVNVLAKDDILDVERSELTRSVDGKVAAVRQYVFKVGHVSSPIFKLPGMSSGPIFVTRKLAQAIVDAGLRGFQFRDPAVNETACLFAGVDVNAFPD